MSHLLILLATLAASRHGGVTRPYLLHHGPGYAVIAEDTRSGATAVATATLPGRRYPVPSPDAGAVAGPWAARYCHGITVITVRVV